MSMDTTLTIATVDRLSMSCRRDQSAVKLPTEIHCATCTGPGVPCCSPATKVATPATADTIINKTLAPTASCLPMNGRATPARMAPSSGAKTAISVSISTLHQRHVLDLDRAAIAEINDQNGEADGGFSRCHGEHEHGEDLPDHVVQRAGKRHEIEVGCQQDQLDRHQDDDDVLPIHEDPEDADHQQQTRHNQIMRQRNQHHKTSFSGIATPSLSLA